MLILGRRINQSIVFPNCGITVRILDINGRVAKVGIEAPQHVEIKRGELVTSALTTGTTPNRDSSIAYTSLCEQQNAPELPVLQFAQRLAEIKAGLHLFQQRRAAGDDAGADQIFGDILNEIAVLDADTLKSLPLARDTSKESQAAFVSERSSEYQISQTNAPVQILIVNDSADRSGFDLPAAIFHGCQICTVNSHQTATCALLSSEPFDFVICNGVSSFDELHLVRTIRSNRNLDATRIFLTTSSKNTKELFELSNCYRIDGWLARPLQPHDLWKHIVESLQFEF